MEYANESVIKALRQYNFLSRSLNLITEEEQKRDISTQMTKIMEHILNITNKVYEEKYNSVVNRTTYLMDEEKERLLELINLIKEREAYIENQISNNKDITGMSFESYPILGKDKLDDYKNQLKIIDKYKNNVKLDNTLKDEIAKLDISIEKAKSKINGNKILNKQLEIRMIKLLDRTFQNLNLYELQERKKEIDLAYTELGYSLEEAKKNANKARKNFSEDIIRECDNLLAASTLEYERYKEKKYILKLIEIYKVPCSDYESILSKREEMNEILTNIINSELYNEVGHELNKEYATIKLEKQDVITLNSLLDEREKKKNILLEINRENESEEFKSMLSNLLENEKKHQEKIKEERKKQEEIERRKKLEEEKKIQEEILKRQRLIEEERKKEIERRTKQLLVEKKNPVLMTEKNDKAALNENNTINRNLKNRNNETNKNIDNQGKKILTREKIIPEKKTRYQSDEKNTLKESILRTSRINQNEKYNDVFKKNSIDKEEIPVIKNNNYNNKMIDIKRIKPNEEIFTMPKLNKEEDIFPKLPNKNDSFFNEDEFEDLNKYVEDKNTNWF